MLKYKISLIGLGTIANHYIGLLESNNMELIAVVDINPNTSARKNIFNKVTYFSDYTKLFDYNLDFVLISATAKNHYSIAKDFLEHRINVICEKPLAETYMDINNLYVIAHKNNVKLISIYHWQYTAEVQWLEKYRQQLGEIKKIILKIHDPYASQNGKNIIEDKIGMLGAVLDEFPNAFSLIDVLLPLDKSENFKIEKKHSIIDSNCGYEIFCDTEIIYKGIPINISVDWRKNLKDKTFILEFDKNYLVEIFHSEGRLYVNNKLSYTWDHSNSLSSQYRTMFANFDVNKDNKRLTEFIFTVFHKLMQ